MRLVTKLLVADLDRPFDWDSFCTREHRERLVEEMVNFLFVEAFVIWKEVLLQVVTLVFLFVYIHQSPYLILVGYALILVHLVLVLAQIATRATDIVTAITELVNGAEEGRRTGNVAPAKALINAQIVS